MPIKRFADLPAAPDFHWESGPKVNSLENVHYMPALGNKEIPHERLQWRTEAKIGSLDKEHMELARPRSLYGGRDGKKVRLLPYRAPEKYKGFRYLEYDPYGRPYARVENEKISGAPKVGSLENKDYQRGGGNVTIVNRRVDWLASSKVGSLDNVHHKPLASNKQIVSEKLDFGQRARPRVAADNRGYVPGGGDVQIINENLNWDTKPKVGSLDNVSHTPRAPTKKIVHEPTRWQAASKVGSLENKDYQPPSSNVAIVDTKLNWDTGARIGSLENAHHKAGGGQVKISSNPTRWEANSKIGSLENAHYTPSRGNVQIVNQNLKWDASPKVGSLDMASHKPGGGNVKIFNDNPNWNASSKVGSLENASYKPSPGNKPIMSTPLPDYRRTVSPRVGSMENANYQPTHSNERMRMFWPKDAVMWPQYEFGRTPTRAFSRNSAHTAQTVP